MKPKADLQELAAAKAATFKAAGDALAAAVKTQGFSLAKFAAVYTDVPNWKDMAAPIVDPAMEEAQALVDCHELHLQQLAGKQVRVVRAVVYEGKAEQVLDQLARSLPPGTKTFGGLVKITVVQGEIHVVEAVEPE